MSPADGTGDPPPWRAAGPGWSVVQLRLPVPKLFVRTVNAYLVRSNDVSVLIDAGATEEPSISALHDGLRGEGIGLGDLRQVLVTHAHRDHTGPGALLRAAGVPVVASGLEARVFERRATDPAGHAGRIRAWLARRGVSAAEAQDWAAALAGRDRPEAFRPEVMIRGRTTLPVGDALRLRLEPSPGHTPGHLVVREPRLGLLFTGDHILPGVAPNVGFSWEFRSNPLPAYRASLEALAGGPPIVGLGGHGDAFDPRSRAAELLRHHDARSARITSVVAAGAGSAHEVARELWPPDEWDGFSPYLKCNAIATTLALLELLVAEGQLARSGRTVPAYAARS